MQVLTLSVHAVCRCIICNDRVYILSVPAFRQPLNHHGTPLNTENFFVRDLLTRIRPANVKGFPPSRWEFHRKQVGKISQFAYMRWIDTILYSLCFKLPLAPLTCTEEMLENVFPVLNDKLYPILSHRSSMLSHRSSMLRLKWRERQPAKNEVFQQSQTTTL